jgi:hypothetical protein
VHLLFLDESGKIDQGGLFALGGIAVRDTDWSRRAFQVRVLRPGMWSAKHLSRATGCQPPVAPPKLGPWLVKTPLRRSRSRASGLKLRLEQECRVARPSCRFVADHDQKVTNLAAHRWGLRGHLKRVAVTKNASDRYPSPVADHQGREPTAQVRDPGAEETLNERRLSVAGACPLRVKSTPVKRLLNGL